MSISNLKVVESNNVKVDPWTHRKIKDLVRGFRSIQDFSENFNVDEIDNSTPTGQHKQDEVRHILSVYFNNDMNQLISFVSDHHDFIMKISPYGLIEYSGESVFMDKSDIVWNKDGSINTDGYFEKNQELLGQLEVTSHSLDGYDDIHLDVSQFRLTLKDDELDNALQTPRL